MPTWILILVFLLAVVAGATASVVGFGIGSLLTPLLALRLGTDVAILVVAFPHLAGGLLRGWRLRRWVDLSILARFGVVSALGGLAGAFLFARLAADLLTPLLGALLLLTALSGLTGRLKRWRPQGPIVWILGGLSGFFGGVVGNQGGLRAAALAAFGLAPTVFVATSTVIGLAIDAVRIPVYLYGGWAALLEQWTTALVAVLGVVAGTLLGERLLFGLSPARFRLVVSAAVGALGLWFLLGSRAL